MCRSLGLAPTASGDGSAGCDGGPGGDAPSPASRPPVGCRDAAGAADADCDNTGGETRPTMSSAVTGRAGGSVGAAGSIDPPHALDAASRARAPY